MKTKKKIHRHRWVKNFDSCIACGAEERICSGCDDIGLFDLHGKLIDIAQ